MRPIGPGARGEDVRDVQTRLGALGYRVDADEHGGFGATTAQAVRAFQRDRQLLVDGLVGEDTWQVLVEAGHTLGDRILYLRLPSYRGDDVRDLQRWLNLLGFDAGREDGIFGERTDRAVREFQQNVGLPGDGIVGPGTVSSLTRLRPVGPGPGRATVREGEALRRLSATLVGALIAVDAGHGGRDDGVIGPTGLTEAAAASDLAVALRDALARRRADPFLVRDSDRGPSTEERASLANQRGAEILVTLHLASDEDPAAAGASCYYFGRGGYSSQAGQRLAELILDELVGNLGLPDRAAQPKALPMLRETRMPAVHVEPCFITNPEDERRLRDPAFHLQVAEGLATALQRFFDGDTPSRAFARAGQETQDRPQSQAEDRSSEGP